MSRNLACRGFGHNWPKPVAGRRRRGLTLRRYADCQELEMICQDCGKARTVTAAPGTVIQLPAERYSYRDPDGYKAPKGTSEWITRRACAAEAWRRWAEEQALPTGGEAMPAFDTGA